MNLWSALVKLSLDLPCGWTPWSCCLLSRQHFGAQVMPTENTQSSFSELSSCSMMFLHGRSLCLPSFLALCVLPGTAGSTAKTRKAHDSVISLFFCILRSESDCRAHFAFKCLTDWSLSHFCHCVYRRWRTEGKGGCCMREEGTEKKEIANPPSKSCFPTCGFKMLPPSPAIL